MKSDINSLAAFGGKPAFETALHVGRPNIGNVDNFLALTKDALERRWLSNHGPYVQALEAKIADMVGVKHCIAMCNGTLALEIAIRACGMQGEVIVPSFTFVATAHALQWQGITPVFCDIDPNTYTLDPRRVEEMITPRTTGIIGVHLWGRTCDVDGLADVARRHNLRLIYDAAHAFHCTHNGQPVGTFGDAEVYSFHATKFVNSLEGGAVVTNNDELAHTMRLMTNFGFEDLDTVTYVGTNGKMNEIAAAMGLVSLDNIEEFVETNYRNYQTYGEELSDIPGLTLHRYDEHERNNYQYIIVRVEEELTGVSRDAIVDILSQENVLARRYFYPGCHRMEPYRSYYPHAGLLLPVTERATRQMLALPTGTAVSSEDIRKIGQILRTIVENGQEISSQLAYNPSHRSLVAAH